MTGRITYASGPVHWRISIEPRTACGKSIGRDSVLEPLTVTQERDQVTCELCEKALKATEPRA